MPTGWAGSRPLCAGEACVSFAESGSEAVRTVVAGNPDVAFRKGKAGFPEPHVDIERTENETQSHFFVFRAAVVPHFL